MVNVQDGEPVTHAHTSIYLSGKSHKVITGKTRKNKTFLDYSLANQGRLLSCGVGQFPDRKDTGRAHTSFKPRLLRALESVLQEARPTSRQQLKN